MDKKSRNTIIISIVALAIVLITVTYAYFSARITGIESASTISLTAGRMSIVYTEGNENVTLTNIYPREEAWVTKTFTLTGTNTTALDMKYNLGLNVETNTFTAGYLTYDLTLVSSTNGTPIATKTNIPINGTGKIKFGTGTFTNADGDTHSYELKIYFKDNGLDQNDSQGAVFNAKVFVTEGLNEPDGWSTSKSGTLLYALHSDNKNIVQIPLTTPGEEASFTAYDDPIETIEDRVFSKTSEELTSMTNGNSKYRIRYANTYAELSDLASGTTIFGTDYGNNYSNLNNKYIELCTYGGIYACKANPYYVRSATSEQMTYSIVTQTPVIIEEDSEALLASTADDYGISYYYRGAVNNNYVVFANMCWRIVRVDGLGNTKLVLYNYNPNNVTNPCASTEDGETNALARYNNEYQSAFNTNFNKNTYIGFMYSNNPDSNDFDTVHANDNDSTILTFLKNWYDEKLRSYNDMLADVIWCNDKSIVTDTTYDPWEFGSIQATGLGTDTTYYKATYRLMPIYDSSTDSLDYSNVSPSLVCPNTGSDGKLSKFTARDANNGNAKLYSNNKEYKIGLLTADEIAFAGASASASNISYYLYKNAIGSSYWSLSPDNFVGDSAGVWNVFGDGRPGPDRVDFSNGVRPAVSLKSDVTISEGNGTQSNPFKITEPELVPLIPEVH